MKKKICSVIAVVLLTLAGFFAVGPLLFLGGCSAVLAGTAVYDALTPDEQQYARVLKNNWGISLPEGFELICSESIPSPHGDGMRYALLRYEDPSVLDGFRQWSAEEGKTFHSGNYIGLVEDAIEYLSVPEEFHPNYENALWWYTRTVNKDPRDEILMLRDGDLLYIIQSIF